MCGFYEFYFYVLLAKYELLFVNDLSDCFWEITGWFKELSSFLSYFNYFSISIFLLFTSLLDTKKDDFLNLVDSLIPN
jgi:hypothetical protein